MELRFTVDRIFNLIFVLIFFFLALQMCRNKDVRRLTLCTCGLMLVVVMLLGVYEVFFGGLVSPRYDTLQQFCFFSRKGQPPTVFNANTNDYNTAIVMLIAAILVDAFSAKNQEPSKGKLWYLFFLFSVGYFLALAGEARLCEVGYFVLLAALCLYALLRGKKCRWLPILIGWCLLVV